MQKCMRATRLRQRPIHLHTHTSHTQQKSDGALYRLLLSHTVLYLLSQETTGRKSKNGKVAVSLSPTRACSVPPVEPEAFGLHSRKVNGASLHSHLLQSSFG
jgi:hypothetical protein